MATRRRCSECRCTFTPSPRALTTQQVCGALCRAARNRKLARMRRRGDVDGYRADERRRQRESRATRAEARGVAPPDDRHAPASEAKSSEAQAEIAQLVDQVVAVSRATLLRDLRRRWPRLREILATGGEVSRASFRGQGTDPTAQSGGVMDARHA
jgi:hypothetical protein